MHRSAELPEVFGGHVDGEAVQSDDRRGQQKWNEELKAARRVSGRKVQIFQRLGQLFKTMMDQRQQLELGLSF